MRLPCRLKIFVLRADFFLLIFDFYFCTLPDMKKIVSAFFCSILILMMISCSASTEVHSFTAMNTFMTVKSTGRNANKANLAVQKEVERLENILSTTIPQSDLYKINNEMMARELDDIENSILYLPADFFLHDETVFLLDKSMEYFQKTGGAFNPSLYPVIREWGFTTGEYKVPSDERINELLQYTDFPAFEFEENHRRVKKAYGMQIDFGAIGKGFAGDRAVEVLKQNGIKSALLDFGGNIQALGGKTDGSAWNVGIKNPWDGSAACGIKIKDACVITSGGYERFFTGNDGKTYIHIFDGKTGRPVENDLESVTIICHEGLYGDALSTSLFVMGKDDAVNFWKSERNFDFVMITKAHELIYSSPIKDLLEVFYEFTKIEVIE